MKIAVAACVLLAACATAGATPSPSEQVYGCWINRDATGVTMRWLRDPAREGVLRGSLIDYGAVGAARSTRYSLEPGDGGYSMCELDGAGAATRCWQVAQGEGGSLDGGRVFIDTHGERLRITLIGDGPDRLVFSGRRDGCD